MRNFGLSLATFAPQTYTVLQARDILLHPDKFIKICDQARDSSGQKTRIDFEDIARQLLDLVKDDQKFLRQVYTVYADGEIKGFLASNAIQRMNAGDDAYFKQVFRGATGKHSYHIKTEALRKISDLTYVKKWITEYATTNEECPNPGANFLLVRGEELYRADPTFVDELAESASNTYVRCAAIGVTSNKTILRKYASISQNKSDQHCYDPHSTTAYHAFLNNIYKAAAVRRLAQLQK